MMMVFAVGAGGCIGAVLRYWMNNAVAVRAGFDFPLGILLINVLGSVIMGLLAGIFAHVAEPPAVWKTFLMTGILGGFTTFSAFSLDTALLMERGAFGMAALYAGGSVALSVLGLFLALWAVRLWLG